MTRKVYLEGILGEKYGAEWDLAVDSPSEALSAIMAQKPGMRQFLIESEGIQGYEVLIGDEGIECLEELVIADPGMGQSYTFVPVIAGSKNSILMMVLGVTLIAMTGGFGAAGLNFFAAEAGATIATAGLSTFGTAVNYLGMGMLLMGASLMLTPDVPDGNEAEKSENYLFSGPVNTVKQGQPIPLVYGRNIVGSKTISASIFTQTSSQKIAKERALVGISSFRMPGSKSAGSNITGNGTGGWVNIPGVGRIYIPVISFGGGGF